MGGSVVRLVKGNPANKVEYSNDPVETAKKWEAAGADMLMSLTSMHSFDWQ